MKKIWNFFSLFLVLVLAGCSAQKDVLYFQDLSEKDSLPIKGNYDVKITYDDLLGISVNSRNPELTTPFTLQSSSAGSSTEGGTPTAKSGGIQYLVDSKGFIEFPILGKIHVAGMTRQELMDYIRERLVNEDYIKDAMVIVNFLNFKISVLGEVNGPGTINVPSDRITILEAISKAGDLTINGRRDRVIVIREENGLRIPYYLDLKSKDVFKSPCFYLKQNDMVYVEPNKTKTRQYNTNQFKNIGTWTSLISFATSIATLIFVAD